jgi:PAS domain S-box-containing protein
MAKQTAAPKNPSPLRHQAKDRLDAGTAPQNVNGPVGLEAMTVLHRLVSAPTNADDALKVLHELQVHQVELDLQHEQMEQGRRDLTEALDRYVEFYDFAPFGYFAVDSESRILDGNLEGAALFGVERTELQGRHIDSFLIRESRPTLLALFKRLRSSGAKEICEVQTVGSGRASRLLQVVASVSPGSQTVLIAFMDTTAHKKLGA